MTWRGRTLTFGRQTRVMGILNVTPDSFSDGGLFADPTVAVEQGIAMASAGAEIIDIGGESTRPFSDAVSAEEETRRVVPVIEALVRRVDIPISIDTKKAAVADRAIAAGAAIINDVSALRADPEMASVAAEHDVPLVLMHMKGTPKTMQVEPVYDDLLGEITDYLTSAIDVATARGVSRDRLIVDPGIGFGKTLDHNLQLLGRLDHFAALDLPLLVGSSRKAFIRRLLQAGDGKALDPLDPAVEAGTQATVAAAILNGAHIVRVHDVANTRRTVRIVDEILNSSVPSPEEEYVNA